MIEKKLRNLVISGVGYKIRKDGNLVSVRSNEGETIRFSPREIEQLIITGEASISSGTVKLLIENGVDLVFVTHRPNFFARVMTMDDTRITDLWKRQILLDDSEALFIAQEMVDSSIYNKLRLLKITDRNRNLGLSVHIERLEAMREEVFSTKDREQLMGKEGASAREYFAALSVILPDRFGFTKRIKHPPTDPINSMLSYGYTVLASRVEYSLMLAGLNPYEGVLHSVYRNRRSLTYDLIEEFRQPIVDRVVMTLAGRGTVAPEDFEMSGDMCMFKDPAKKVYLNALYQRMEEKHNYEGESIPFLDIIYKQAKALAESIENGILYRGFKWR